MEDIAREAGVSKGALYLTWPGKEELFDALLEYEMKNLLLDLRKRIDSDPNGSSLASLYSHTLLAMQANPLVMALYTRESKILGDFVHRQDPGRYTNRLLMSTESISQFQAAGQIRADIKPQVIAHLFMLMALGFMNINSLIAPEAAPPITETAAAMSALVQSGLCGSAINQKLPKEAIYKMIDLMLEQYSEKGKNEENIE